MTRNKKRKRKRKKTRFREQREAINLPRIMPAIKESESDLCKSLWQAVILQGLYDITSEGNDIECKIVRAEATAWFGQGVGKNRVTNFETVCNLAGMDAGFVQKIAKKVMQEGSTILEGLNTRIMRNKTSLNKENEL